MANTLDDASHVVIIVAKKNARYDSDFLLQTLAKRNLPEDQMQMRWTGTKSSRCTI